LGRLRISLRRSAAVRALAISGALSAKNSFSCSLIRSHGGLPSTTSKPPETSEVSETSEVLACDAIPTPYFTVFYGTVMLGNRPYPAGAWVEALSPRDEVVGCSQIVEQGVYPFLRVYGADEDIPGMEAGEAVAFRVNGQIVELDNPPSWQNDRDVHELDLRVEPIWLYLPLVWR
jgi:hypothetical protein